MTLAIVLEFIKTQNETLELKRIEKEGYPMFQFYERNDKKRYIGYFGMDYLIIN
jgi:hypothetical protein